MTSSETTFNDAELIESLRLWNRDDAADRIEQLVATTEALTADLARSTRLISKMVPLSACGNYVFWDGVGDIELDHNGELRNRIEGLNEQLEAARADAKEAEAYADELEKELNTCRMAQAVMDYTVADLEGKLAKAVEALDYCINAPFSGWTIAQGYARAILAEIKLQSSEFATQKGVRAMNDLKPCPFCGCKDVGEINTNRSPRIHCYRCGADGPIIPYAEDTKFWTWNTRAGESHD